MEEDVMKMGTFLFFVCEKQKRPHFPSGPDGLKAADNRGRGVSSKVAAGSGVFVATSRIVAEYPELQFW
jgi:hypothetical protein